MDGGRPQPRTAFFALIGVIFIAYFAGTLNLISTHSAVEDPSLHLSSPRLPDEENQQVTLFEDVNTESMEELDNDEAPKIVKFTATEGTSTPFEGQDEDIHKHIQTQRSLCGEASYEYASKHMVKRSIIPDRFVVCADLAKFEKVPLLNEEEHGCDALADQVSYSKVHNTKKHKDQYITYGDRWNETFFMKMRHRSNFTVPFLPPGVVNDLSDEVVEQLRKTPTILHYFLKVDFQPSAAAILRQENGRLERFLGMPKSLYSCLKVKTFRQITKEFHRIYFKTRFALTMKVHARKVGKKCFSLKAVLPETYIIKYKSECKKFFTLLDEETNKLKTELGDENLARSSAMKSWIMKKASSHGGKSVKILTPENEGDYFKAQEERCPQHHSKSIAQRYMQNILLIEGRKFDIRAYFFIANTNPTYVYFVPSYFARLAPSKYTANSRDNNTVLTNLTLARDLGMDTQSLIMTRSDLQDYFFSTKQRQNPQWIAQDWDKQMKHIISHIIQTLKFAPDVQNHYALMAIDFMVTEDFQLKVIEVNKNPALYGSPGVLKSKMMDTAMSILEQQMFEGRSMEEIDCDYFEPLYDGSRGEFFGNIERECVVGN